MIESIYYLRLDRVPVFLNGLADVLSPDGTVLVRLHDVEEHHEYVGTFHQVFAETEWVSSNLLCLACPLSVMDRAARLFESLRGAAE